MRGEPSVATDGYFSIADNPWKKHFSLSVSDIAQFCYSATYRSTDHVLRQ
jgi:hypothetical protein